ncbi:MAG: fused MFS/spermidine synthase [Candidatus Eisenbacteria sp.]|nr:fused MFS/spermidine synthase [Candidatus Eisenbacteria bacterium]
MSKYPHRLAYVLFFASGISGLVYEIIWMRQLGNVFGNTIHAAATAAAVFMLGLGVGGLVVGRIADARIRNIRWLLGWYAICEVLIGVLGLLLVLGIPRMSGLSVLISEYSAIADPYFHLTGSTTILRILVSAVLLLPPTFLMGGTLALLAKYVSRSIVTAGSRIGLLYALNTAGAALGCFATDFILIRSMGVLNTGILAAVINGVVGIGSLAFLYFHRQDRAEEIPEQETPLVESREPRTDRLVVCTVAAFGISGFCGMALEIIWFRVVGSYLLDFRAALSVVLAVVLVGIVAGAWIAANVRALKERPLFMFAVSQVLLAYTALGSLLLLTGAQKADIRGALYNALYPVTLDHFGTGYFVNFLTTLLLILIPAILMGISFPLVNMFFHRSLRRIGRGVGVLYACNTAGATLGALAQGFVFLALLGSQGSTLLIAVLLTLSGSYLLWALGARRAVAGLVTASVILGVLWSRIPEYHVMDGSFRMDRDVVQVLYRHEGVSESIMIAEGLGGCRGLFTNGYSMTQTTFSALRYMKITAHLPLLLQENPKKVCIICYGVGNTVRAASLHPSLERIDVVEISGEILSLSPYFESTNYGVLQHPKVRAFVNDGRHHLLLTDEKYDLITSEPPPIALAHVVSLYTREYYELVRDHLTPGGFCSQWLPIHQLDPWTIRKTIKAFVDVFPHTILVSGWRDDLILVGSMAPIRLDAAYLAEQLEIRKEAREEMEMIGLGSLPELLGIFVMGEQRLKKYLAPVDAVTDDRPYMEYATCVPISFPPDPQLFQGVDEIWRYYDDSGLPEPEARKTREQLRAFIDVLKSFYTSRGFHEVLMRYDDLAEDREYQNRVIRLIDTGLRPLYFVQMGFPGPWEVEATMPIDIQ